MIHQLEPSARARYNLNNKPHLTNIPNFSSSGNINRRQLTLFQLRPVGSFDPHVLELQPSGGSDQSRQLGPTANVEVDDLDFAHFGAKFESHLVELKQVNELIQTCLF